MDRSQLEKEVREAILNAQKNVVGFTTRDLMAAMKCSESTAHKIRNDLMGAGAVEFVGRVPYTQADNKRGWRPAYRFVREGEADAGDIQ